MAEGLGFESREEYALAVDAFSRALVEAPDDSVAACYVHRARCYYKLGQYDKSADEADLALEHDAASDEAHAIRGSARCARGEWFAALMDYRSAKELKSARAEEYEKMLRWIARNCLEHEPAPTRVDESTLGAWRVRGLSHYHLDEFAEAARAFTGVLKSRPEDCVALTHRGLALCRLEKHERGAADLTRAIKLGEDGPEIRFHRGVALKRLGKADHALSDLTRCLRQQPRFAVALFERSGLLVARGDLSRAIRDLSAAIQAEPTSADYRIERAKLLMRTGRLEAAAEDYQAAIDLLPTDLELYLLRGESLLQAERHGAALECFQQAIDLDVQCGAAFIGRGRAFAARGEPEAAVRELTKAIRLEPRSAAAYAARGEASLSLGEYKAAAEDLTRAAKWGPPSELPRLRRLRAEALAQMENYQPALADLTAYLEQFPDDVEARAHRGFVQSELGRWEEAIDDISRAIRSAPERADEFTRLGRTCSQKAIDHFTRLIETEPRAEWFRKRALAFEFHEDSRRALSDYNAALKLDPQLATCLARRAALLEMSGDHARAIEDYTRLIELEQQVAEAFFRRGCCFQARNNPPKAERDFSKALELDPERGDYLLARGRFYTRIGRLQDAEADLSRALQLNDGLAEAWIARGAARGASGERESGLADLDRGLSLQPSGSGFLERARLRSQLKQWGGTIDDCSAAIALDDSLCEAYFLKAIAYARRSEFQHSLTLLTRAISRMHLDWGYAVGFEHRARVYYSMGQFERAEADYTRLLELAPAGHDLTRCWVGRGLARVQLHRRDQALADFHEALDRSPTNKVARAGAEHLEGQREQRPPELAAPLKRLPLPKPLVVRPPLAIRPDPQWNVDPLWDQWLIRGKGNAEYGPYAKGELDELAREGRIAPDTRLWRIDWEATRAADEIYAELHLERHRSDNRPMAVDANAAFVPQEPQAPPSEPLPAPSPQPAAPVEDDPFWQSLAALDQAGKPDKE